MNSVNKMYGSFEQSGSSFSSIWVWMPDVNIGLTKDEQYKYNKEHVPGFKSIKIRKPGLRMSLA